MAPRPGRPSELRDPLRARAEIESEQPAPRALELNVRPRLDYLGEPWREVARGAGVRVADLVDLTRQLDCRRDRDRDHAAEGGAMIQIRGIAQQCSPPEAAQLDRARHGDLYHRAQLRSHHAVVHEQRARSQHAALRADIDDRARTPPVGTTVVLPLSLRSSRVPPRAPSMLARRPGRQAARSASCSSPAVLTPSVTRSWLASTPSRTGPPARAASSALPPRRNVVLPSESRLPLTSGVTAGAAARAPASTLARPATASGSPGASRSAAS